MSSATSLSIHDGDLLLDPTEYRHIVGALQYCTITWPDICFATNKVCQFMHSPTSTHWNAIKRILRYLKGTISHGLTFQGSSDFSLLCYIDSDWASYPDNRKSTSGYCSFLGPNLISWSSSKQRVVSRSSAELEYCGLANAATEICWLEALLTELHIPGATCPLILCDNISATYLAANLVMHARTKHIEIDYHFFRDHVVN